MMCFSHPFLFLFGRIETRVYLLFLFWKTKSSESVPIVKYDHNV